MTARCFAVSVERHFLGWDEPLTARICDFLLPKKIAGPVDLSGQLIVVPTSHAGRRLREALALRCARHNTGLIAAQIVTPGFLVRSHAANEREADPTTIKAVWDKVLLNGDMSNLRGLFPTGIPDRDSALVMNTGEMIQKLRLTLAESALTISDVLAAHGTDLEEQERWRDMAKLETDYLKCLRELAMADPCERQIISARSPEPPDGTASIVVASVLDLSPLHAQALAHLSKTFPVAILVPAPASQADFFDEWGRPAPDKWRSALIDIPDESDNIVLTTSPSAQSRAVMLELARESTRFGSADIAICAADRGVIPFIAAELEEKRLPAFDPSDKLLKNHALYHLIEAFSDLVMTRSYPAFRNFMRHPDVLHHLQSDHQASCTTLLCQIDACQNIHLPSSLDDIKHAATPGELATAVTAVEELINAVDKSNCSVSVRQFLQTIYTGRTLDSQIVEHDEFSQAAAQVDTALRELAEVENRITTPGGDYAMQLLMRTLSDKSYHSERNNEAIDLEGWFEALWNDAPFLVVTGMNDGIVPDGKLDDVFLPDSFRTRLGLQNDALRLARDAIIMTCLIESRRKQGRTCFICGKTSGTGDPLKPSRLLFKCKPDKLAARAAVLFGSASDHREVHAPTHIFKLNPVPPTDVAQNRIKLQKMSVTWFRDYLECPFRFYLKHVLDMETIDDEKREMDGRDFGTMIHEVLKAMTNSKSISTSADETQVGAFLGTELDRCSAKLFGKSPSLPVLISLDAARQRLAAAARVQAQLVRDGWEIVQVEQPFSLNIGGMEVRGKIDRMDRNKKTGAIRIIDYKTSDTAVSPEEAHFERVLEQTPDFAKITINNKPRRWADLQLPLYMLFTLGESAHEQAVEPAYFNIPKAVNQTDVQCWDNFNRDIMKSAQACASAVVKAIQSCIFWPPSGRVTHDDFESLFLGAGVDSFDADDFVTFWKRQSDSSPKDVKR